MSSVGSFTVTWKNALASLSTTNAWISKSFIYLVSVTFAALGTSCPLRQGAPSVRVLLTLQR
jgi:hypothetical protein